MVKQFLMNLLLAFIWVALTGVLYFSNFYFGFLLGFFILWLMNRDGEDHRYFNRVPRIISFVLYFVYEMIKANIEVAYGVLSPKFHMQPAIVKYPLHASSDFEVNMLATIISLTPGSLIMDISEDKKVLYIHVMHLKNNDRELFIQKIERVYERRLLEIIR
ncbi:Na+/H+ antiporter subunit E [Olivibacter sitiensis]|uniref:Na+/H+ antiporter subunit E n=1 Tax=Olivibacter sitiensis TaxID=376470 RepID=UPI0004229957|nr:Na+/H+ antiporter subunit E [Olivibacter sitiensis]